MMRLMLSAGEASGDMYAVDLIAELRQRTGELDMFGMGGPLMRDAGVELLFNPTNMSTVGFVESLRSVKVMRRVLGRLGAAMDERRPDVVVCIDFPGFNMKLAELARRRNIPVVYYFSPSVWAWGRGRADRLARLGVTVCAVFPFEEEVYKQAGADVVFVGHPLVDRVKAQVARDDVRRELGVGPEQPLIALLPGSREQELRHMLGPMFEAAVMVHGNLPGARFVIPVAHTLTAQSVKQFLPTGGAPLAVIEGRTYDMMNAADAALVSMGTATLEAALLGLPHVACYRTSGPTYLIARRLVNVSYFALPNIIAARGIVPEVIQSEATGARLARELMALLEEHRQATMRDELAEVRAAVGEGGAAGRTADVILSRARPTSTEMS